MNKRKDFSGAKIEQKYYNKHFKASQTLHDNNYASQVYAQVFDNTKIKPHKHES